jgi:hypothetical protein
MAQKGTVGALSNNDKQVAFFPNPATTFINFEFKNPVEKGSVLEVYSFLGRRMANINVVSRRMTVTLNEYVTGIYVFQLRDAAGRVVETNKFQVAK